MDDANEVVLTSNLRPGNVIALLFGEEVPHFDSEQRCLHKRIIILPSLLNKSPGHLIETLKVILHERVVDTADFNQRLQRKLLDVIVRYLQKIEDSLHDLVSHVLHAKVDLRG